VDYVGTRISTVVNGKGGVGKTTTAHALATGLTKKGLRTLAIDYDPQGNLSHAYGIDVNNSPTMYHVINGDVALMDAIQQTKQGDIIAGNSSLSKMSSLFPEGNILEGIPKLKEELVRLEQIYKFIIIDNQPLLGSLLTMHTMVAANDLIVPMSADDFAVQGLAKLQEAIIRIKQGYNTELKIDGLLMTRYNPRILHSNHINQNLIKWTKVLNTRVYKTFIREGVAVREAHTKRQSIFAYAPFSKPSQDYNNFIAEYAGRKK
jgi:chromosome partitioning protein